MRFKIDEHLPVEIAELLDQHQHDAVTVADESMSGAVDPDVARTCQKEARALITLDLDFSDIRAYPPKSGHSLRADHTWELLIVCILIRTPLHKAYIDGQNVPEYIAVEHVLATGAWFGGRISLTGYIIRETRGAGARTLSLRTMPVHLVRP